MFRDCGWEYVQDYMGYSYFRKPAPASERDAEIFCDDASRLEMMEPGCSRGACFRSWPFCCW